MFVLFWLFAVREVLASAWLRARASVLHGQTGDVATAPVMTSRTRRSLPRPSHSALHLPCESARVPAHLSVASGGAKPVRVEISVLRDECDTIRIAQVGRLSCAALGSARH